MSGNSVDKIVQKKSTGAARIGIGGPVGSGKTALIERLIPAFSQNNIEVAHFQGKVYRTKREWFPKN